MAEYLDGLWVEAAAVAFPTERGDRARVRQETARLPAPAEQLVEVVGDGRAGAGGDALFEVGVVQQPDLAVVDQLVFLALAQLLDILAFIGARLYQTPHEESTGL